MGSQDRVARGGHDDSIAGIDEILPGSDIAIYPNPANGSFNIRYTGISNKNFYLTLFNTVGEKVKEEFLPLVNHSDVPVNISTLPAGFYFVQLQSGQNTFTKKIVVE